MTIPRKRPPNLMETGGRMRRGSDMIAMKTAELHDAGKRR